MAKEKVIAVVLAAGQGKRMNSSIKKQYLLLNEKPLIYYALKTFENSRINEVILVVAPGEIEYCQKEIVEYFGFQKVSAIIEGGKERYHSVYEALKIIETCDYILIHDGARPLINDKIVNRCILSAKEFGACVIGMPVKDTIRVVDDKNFSKVTPSRKSLWTIQTPQAFSFSLLRESYEKIMQEDPVQCQITDDAMVVEMMAGKSVKIIEGSYENIKVTTPEDILLAQILMKNKGLSDFVTI